MSATAKENQMHMIFKSILLLLMLFVVPVAGAAGWWAASDRPSSWRNADWGSSGLLSGNPDTGKDVIYVMAARTGGFKGAFSVHSWLVTKRADEQRYSRYDKVGWGSPVRKNAYAADANWYSNPPQIIAKIEGDKAEALIPKIEAAIQAYPYSERGDYTIWPGPNSNTFVEYVLRQVPELGVTLPPHAVGRDFLGKNVWFMREADGSDTHLSAFGLIGLSFGARTGFELHFLGQSFGFDFQNPAIKLPAFGRLELS